MPLGASYDYFLKILKVFHSKNQSLAKDRKVKKLVDIYISIYLEKINSKVEEKLSDLLMICHHLVV